MLRFSSLSRILKWKQINLVDLYAPDAMRCSAMTPQLRRFSSSNKWKIEPKTGYFDDFSQLKKMKGKVFHARHDLTPIDEAMPFPVLQFLDPDGSTVQFPSKQKKVALVCVSFSEYAKDAAKAWISIFGEISSVENRLRINVVEHKLLSLWPFRWMTLSGAKSDRSARILFHFGKCKPWCDALEIKNKLTVYVFLIDHHDRVRWKATGNPTDEEIKILQHCTAELNR